MASDLIRYTTRRCAFGWLLLAATPRGVCNVRLGDDRARLVRELEEEFAFARIEPDARGLAPWLASLEAGLAGRGEGDAIPLDVAGSRFEQRVWRAIARIPRGETRSYAAVARALGRPGAARAVGRACGRNPTPLLVPCHRVVRSDGSPGGYRFGARAKRRLLEREADAERK